MGHVFLGSYSFPWQLSTTVLNDSYGLKIVNNSYTHVLCWQLSTTVLNDSYGLKIVNNSYTHVLWGLQIL